MDEFSLVVGSGCLENNLVVGWGWLGPIFYFPEKGNTTLYMERWDGLMDGWRSFLFLFHFNEGKTTFDKNENVFLVVDWGCSEK